MTLLQSPLCLYSSMYILREKKERKKKKKTKQKKKNLYNRSFWHNQLIHWYSCAGISLFSNSLLSIGAKCLNWYSFTMDFERDRGGKPLSCQNVSRKNKRWRVSFVKGCSTGRCRVLILVTKHSQTAASLTSPPARTSQSPRSSTVQHCCDESRCIGLNVVFALGEWLNRNPDITLKHLSPVMQIRSKTKRSLIWLLPRKDWKSFCGKINY